MYRFKSCPDYKNRIDYAGAYPERAGRTMYTTNRNLIT